MYALLNVAFALLAGLLMTRLFSRWHLPDVTAFLVAGVLIGPFCLGRLGITLGAIATATAPAATLMPVRQYKAKGPLTSLLLPIVALDDAVGLVVFAVSFGIAKAMISGALSIVSVLVNPLIEIALSLLLVCMMLGTVFCNVCPLSVFRSTGKYFGARWSAKAVGCDKKTVKYLGITLLPQAGVALGMCVSAQELGAADGLLVRNIVPFSVLIYELVGPLLTKEALTAAGEITAKPKEILECRAKALAEAEPKEFWEEREARKQKKRD